MKTGKESKARTARRAQSTSFSLFVVLIAALLLTGFAFYAYGKLSAKAGAGAGENAQATVEANGPVENLIRVLDSANEYVFSNNTITIVEKAGYAKASDGNGKTTYEEELSFANGGETEFETGVVDVVPPIMQRFYRYANAQRAPAPGNQNNAGTLGGNAIEFASNEGKENGVGGNAENSGISEIISSRSLSLQTYFSRVKITPGGILRTTAKADLALAVGVDTLNQVPIHLLTNAELNEEEAQQFVALTQKINALELNPAQAKELERKLNKAFAEYSSKGKPLREWFAYADFVIVSLASSEEGRKAFPEKIVFNVSEKEPEAKYEFELIKELESGVALAPITGGAAKYVSYGVTEDETGTKKVVLTAFVDADYDKKQLPFDSLSGELRFFVFRGSPVTIPIEIKVDHEKTKSSLQLTKGVYGAACKQGAITQPPKLASKTELDSLQAAKRTKEQLLAKCLKEGSAVVNYARNYCGVAYDEGCSDFWLSDLKAGRTPKKFNCACFVTFALEKSGLNGFYTQSAPSLLELTKRNGGLEVKANELLPGDLVFFKTYPGSANGEITHVEFYAGDDELLGSGNPVQTHDFWERFAAYYECNSTAYGKTKCAADAKWWGKRIYRTALRVIPSCVEYTKLERAENAG